MSEADSRAATAAPRLARHGVQVYAINRRSHSEAEYLPDIDENIRLCGVYGATGVLCFSGNDTQIDPWLIANRVAAQRDPDGLALTPLVALNPNTMPPYTAAKMIASLEQLHGGRVALNLITGLSARDREILGDELPHEARYERLEEYAWIVTRLLGERRPVSAEGRFYRIRDATLLPRTREPRAPDLYLAGHSLDARRVAAALNAVRLQMLAPDLAEGLPKEADTLALHFGLIARPAEADAWAAAERFFPADPDGQAVLDMTMRYLDSEWKRELHARLSADGERRGPFWLGPFRNFQSDCPFLVGSREEVAQILADLLSRGVTAFILDLPPEDAAFAEAAQAFELAYRLVGLRSGV